MGKKRFPEPVVGALVFNPQGKLLLVRGHKWMGRYSVAGGHIELGESMADALRREIKEETGLKIHDIVFVRVSESVFGKEFWKKRHFIYLDFACKVDSSRVRLNDESEEFGWFSFKDLKKLKIESTTRSLIDEYRRRSKRQSA